MMSQKGFLDGLGDESSPTGMLLSDKDILCFRTLKKKFLPGKRSNLCPRGRILFEEWVEQYPSPVFEDYALFKLMHLLNPIAKRGGFKAVPIEFIRVWFAERFKVAGSVIDLALL